MRTYLLIINCIFLLVLTACSSSLRVLEHNLDGLVGNSERQALDMFGEPNQTLESDGKITYVWEYSNINSSSDTDQESTASAEQLECLIKIGVRDGIVENWEAHGNRGCDVYTQQYHDHSRVTPLPTPIFPPTGLFPKPVSPSM